MKVNVNSIQIGKKVRAINEEKVKDLIGSISLIGLNNPICVTSSLELVSGLHRLEACRRLGHEFIECHVLEISGQLVDIARLDENLMRNDLTVLERSQHIFEREKLIEKIEKSNSAQNAVDANNGDSLDGENVSKAQRAAVLIEKVEINEGTVSIGKLSERSLQDYKQIARDIPGTVKSIIKGEEMANSKRELLNLARIKSSKTQRAVAESIKSGKSKNVQQAVRNIKYKERIQNLTTPESLESIGTFDVIYADPPWTYDVKISESRDVALKYPVMTLDKIKNLQVPSAEDAVLFLWVPSGLLVEGFEVIKAWGFQYKSQCIWLKDRPGMGFWFRAVHEFLLVSTKGNFPKPPAEKLVYSVIHTKKKLGHSEKPDRFYQIIESYYPGRRYLELFATKKRKGWKPWGNEVQVVKGASDPEKEI